MHGGTLPLLRIPSLARSMGHGALAAAALLVLLLLADVWDAGRHGALLPALVVPAAGAVGGGALYIADRLRYDGGWSRLAALALALPAYTLLVLFALLAALALTS